MKAWLVFPGLLLITGCSWFGTSEYAANSPRIGELLKDMPVNPLQEPAPLPAGIELSELIERLERVQPTLAKRPGQAQLARRVAELRLESVDRQLADGAVDIDYATPIESLGKLLAFEVSDEVASLIAYQTARLQALAGAPQMTRAALSEVIAAAPKNEPPSPVVLEAHFRRGEIYFSNKAFAEASLDYAVVSGMPGQYQLHARYMLTWVQFKLGDLDGALANAMQALSELSDKAARQQELRDDLVRVTVIALDYLDGVETLARLMLTYDKPNWQTEIYRALGDWYLEKERYSDSAATWTRFLSENPLHRDAPTIALQVIETQKIAGFMDVIDELEQSFVMRYGKQGAFYKLHGEAVFSTYREPLKSMLDRMTLVAHADAQAEPTDANRRTANDTYALWLENFPNAADAQQQRFLYAEMLQASDRLTDAVEQFEWVVQMDPITIQAREAAYALVLAYEELPTSTVDQRIAASLQFTERFSDDPRAITVQLNAAKLLFEQQDYGPAIAAANRALELGQPIAGVDVAQRILAHSAFELARFGEAASRYRQILAISPDQAITKRLLAAVFNQGQAAEAANDLTAAIEFYDELRAIDGDSSLAIDAQYDIAALLEASGDVTGAINQLLAYRQQYGGQQAEIATRLIALYEQAGQPSAAAQELLASATSVAPDQQRLARYRAAELFLEAGATQQAIEHFRHYAHNYPEPENLRFEAMHHMDQLYQLTGEPSKRAYWLRKKRDTYFDVTDATPRIRYLAAESSFLLAENTYQNFVAIPLDLPLTRSIKNKRQKLEASLKAYQTVADIGVLSFTSEANHRMAQLYEQLARDLMASERPAGLNELEREQYDMLLEEQAFPFEEEAISLYELNLAFGWKTEWTSASEKSLAALQTLMPGRFARREQEVNYVSMSR